ncbi:GNAT family N-acetyltransferase [Aspergillus undulatus]|uniref:GNAT family N-acetyltransferase n=1 Tax=Aspergillus undulatus TaxID=1810928 RepID=UPI003CCDFE48
MATISPTTAHLIETAEISFINAQIHAAQQLFPSQNFIAEPIGGGVAAVTKQSFGRKLNHVAGFGMNGPVSEKDLEAIERLYREIGASPEINLCPFAHQSVREALDKMGWTICAEMNVHVLSLRGYKKTESEFQTADEIHITPVSTEEYPIFIETATTGFGYNSTSDQLDLFHALASVATRRPDTRLYFARINGQIAGAAGLALITTPLGRVAELYIDSTTPEFRGKGVQTALLRARLEEAKKEGIEVATVTTWPTGTSARNVERVGFVLGYRKDVFTTSTT